ncbi:MAG TPA: hypothetical protein DCR46_05420 [Cytophagales bacterium]|nr:hypothetical protein [Cytophagales bacterium]
MEPVKIFVLNIDQETLEKALNFLKSKSFEADGTTEPENALQAFQQKNYDMVVFGGGISGKTREMLKKEFMHMRPEVEFIEHLSHPSEMYEEIMDAFKGY